MAQTIAVQRGQTTVTNDGATKTTLFTQSSGIATRVIVGGISVVFASSQANAVYMCSINSNGSGNYIPVIYRSHNQYNIRYLNTWPSSDGTTASSLTGQYSNTVSQNNGVSLGSTAANGMPEQLWNWTAGIYQGPIAAEYMCMNISPSNFWMANGDSLVIQTRSGSAGTATVNYHFITVTES